MSTLSFPRKKNVKLIDSLQFQGIGRHKFSESCRRGMRNLRDYGREETSLCRSHPLLEVSSGNIFPGVAQAVQKFLFLPELTFSAGSGMTSRERLDATLKHRQPDRVCVDFGAGGQTGMGVGAVHHLRQAILPDPGFRVKVTEPYQMLGEVDLEMIKMLRLDAAGVSTPDNMFGFRNEGWKSFITHDGIEVLVPGKFNYTLDPEGAVLMYPEGDTSVPPCAKMPRASFFFDALPRQQGTTDDASLNVEENTEEFGLLSPADLDYYSQEVNYLYEQTDLGIYVTLPGMGFGDIALVPAPWMKHPKGIRDVQEWYMSLVARPGYVRAIFEKQCEFALRNIELLYGAIGDRAQAVFVTGTDFGTQTGLFASLDAYRELFKPYHVAVNRKIHKLTPWKTFIHSCGAVSELIPDLIEAGFDILNPVQISARGMDARHLKKEFGKDIVFWGGGVDTQKTLPFGTPDEVYREVRENIGIFAEGGGFVFNSVHNVQSNVPVENILAMFRALDDARDQDTDRKERMNREDGKNLEGRDAAGDHRIK